MPVIKSARKKLKQDRIRALRNKKLKGVYKKALRETERNPSEKNVVKTISIVDKISKKNIIHKNKASRIKSRLSRLIKIKRKPAKKNEPSGKVKR